MPADATWFPGRIGSRHLSRSNVAKLSLRIQVLYAINFGILCCAQKQRGSFIQFICQLKMRIPGRFEVRRWTKRENPHDERGKRLKICAFQLRETVGKKARRNLLKTKVEIDAKELTFRSMSR